MKLSALIAVVAVAAVACTYPGRSTSDNTIDQRGNDPFILECVGGGVEGEMTAFAEGTRGAGRIEDVIDRWSNTESDVVLEVDGDRARLALVQVATGRTIAVITMVDLGDGWLEESKERCSSP